MRRTGLKPVFHRRARLRTKEYNATVFRGKDAALRGRMPALPKAQLEIKPFSTFLFS
jgi:hypothetical protein